MKALLPTVSFLLLIACSSGPAPINYGVDACSFCQMTIVDKQHAAEVVTVKGRSYKYDAIECMMNAQRTWELPPVRQFLVCDYANPGQLIDATNAYYLVSEDIPSPMGEFLTAFSSEQERNSATQNVKELLDWEGLKNKFQIK